MLEGLFGVLVNLIVVELGVEGVIGACWFGWMWEWWWPVFGVVGLLDPIIGPYLLVGAGFLPAFS